ARCVNPVIPRSAKAEVACLSRWGIHFRIAWSWGAAMGDTPAASCPGPSQSGASEVARGDRSDFGTQSATGARSPHVPTNTDSLSMFEPERSAYLEGAVSPERSPHKGGRPRDRESPEMLRFAEGELVDYTTLRRRYGDIDARLACVEEALRAV